MIHNIITIIFFSILIISFYTDIKERRILNIVTLPTIVLGIILNIFVSATLVDGLLFSVYGILLGFVVLFIPYILGGIGAGDVKLLMAIGALMGPWFTLYSAIYMGIVGGLLAIIQLVKAKQLTYTIKKILFLNQVSKEEFENTIPYGVAIAIGAIITYFLY